MGKMFIKPKHGLRGSDFENRINTTIEYYRDKKLALIQKIPTPITPVKLGEKKGQISLAFFDKQSTVDYIGVVQEIPVCFDAKETQFENRIPLQKSVVNTGKGIQTYKNPSLPIKIPVPRRKKSANCHKKQSADFCTT